jgi:hypothetical protein
MKALSARRTTETTVILNTVSNVLYVGKIDATFSTHSLHLLGLNQYWRHRASAFDLPHHDLPADDLLHPHARMAQPLDHLINSCAAAFARRLCIRSLRAPARSSDALRDPP